MKLIELCVGALSIVSLTSAAVAAAAPLPSSPATLLAGAPAAKASAPAPGEADWRTPDPGDVIVIETSKGRIFVELAPDIAPLSAARIRELTRSQFYDGRAFFRVIDNFMDQTGDPKDNGTGGSTLPNLPPEFVFRRSSDMPFTPVTKESGRESGFIGNIPVVSQLMELGALTADNKVAAIASFCPGVGGLARADAVDSANSQFFLMRGTNSALNGKYAVWGRVIAGLDVVRAIKTGEPPAPPADKMLTVRLLADLPASSRPSVRVIDTRGAWFKATVERLRADKVADLSLCDIDLPSQVK